MWPCLAPRAAWHGVQVGELDGFEGAERPEAAT